MVTLKMYEIIWAIINDCKNVKKYVNFIWLQLRIHRSYVGLEFYQKLFQAESSVIRLELNVALFPLRCHPQFLLKNLWFSKYLKIVAK